MNFTKSLTVRFKIDKMKPSLISGERFYSLEEANLIKKLFLKAAEVFESFGYDYINLSHFEPYEFQEKAFGERVKEALIFKDTNTGEIFSLRFDFTTQVVRTVLSLKNLTLPERIYYFGNVFSLSNGYEKLQTGVEFLGSSSINADIEVIEVLFNYLKSIGFKNVKVILSHANIVKKIARKNEKILKAFYERNYDELSKILKENVKNFMLVSEDREILKVLEKLNLNEEKKELEEFSRTLESIGIPFKFDLCELRKFPYYSGIIFEIYDEDRKISVAGGGRYDTLSRIYDKNIPATGGAVYLEKVIDYMQKEKNKKDYFIIDKENGNVGREIADILRKKGKKVGIETESNNLERSLIYAFEKGFKEVIVLEKGSLKVYTTPKDYVIMKVKEFLELL